MFPGAPLRAHWGLPDPADVEGADAVVDAAFEETGRLLELRIRALLALDAEALSAKELQQALAEIGAIEGAA